MNISIESDNLYYKKGLELLISASLSDIIRNNKFPITILSPEGNDLINIIFRDASISINIFDNKQDVEKNTPEHKSTIHIPFTCKNKTLTDINCTIRKIIKIAKISNNDLVNDDFYRATGIRRNEQLSLTETKIMLLIGKGNNINSISRQLHRSVKTINVHCRNASRKMKVDNKVEFYNYAKFIVNCQRNERKTLCL